MDEAARLTAAEVKSSATVAADFFDSLRRLGDHLARTAPHLEFDPRIVFGGETGQRRSDVTVIPWKEIHRHQW